MPVVHAEPDPKSGPRIFISYSHKDQTRAAAFHEALCALALNNADLGLDESRIFFDREHLLAGDDWSERIETELDLADIFILLLSTACSRSKYCFEKELATAAKRGIVIIPVLLCDAPSWETRRVEGDPKKRELIAFQAVPVTEHGPEPIFFSSIWEPQYAIAQAVKAIGKRLMRDMPQQAARDLETKRRPSGRPAPPIDKLQALCNQHLTEKSFESGLDRWSKNHALVVLVKGLFEDAAPACWERLCDANLTEFCEEEGLRISSAQPFAWPMPAPSILNADLAAEVRRNLSKALFGNGRKLRTGRDLAAVLANEAGLLVLTSTIPALPPAETARWVSALMALLDEMPEETPARRLVVAVIVESSELVEADDLVGLLKLPDRSDRCQLIETSALQPLEREHVKLWYREWGWRLKDQIRLGEGELLSQLFTQNQLRHRPFGEQLLKLTKHREPIE
jgi:hypothetical protein